MDNNGLQIDRKVDAVNSPYPIDKKFEAFNFHVINMDGHDFSRIALALTDARNYTGRPTAIIAKTVKGKGISFMEDKAGWHGVAPSDAQYVEAMAELYRPDDCLEAEIKQTERADSI